MGDDLHIDGLLHLATFAFAMTLAYLGLDKVRDQAREHLDASLQDKEREIVSFLSHADLLQNHGRLNELHEVVGGPRTRKAICMLCTLGNIRHDLYQGWGSGVRERWHAFQLFIAFRCYLGHWDLVAVALVSVISGLIFLGLTGATTFRVSIGQTMVVLIYIIDAAAVLFVIATASHAANASTNLDKKYRKWKESYEAWLRMFKAKKIENLDAQASQAITPPEDNQGTR